MIIPALNLEIFKQESSLKMGLFAQNDPIPTLKHYSQVPVSFTEISDLCFELINILNRAARCESAKAEQIKSMYKVGQLLWDHLLSRSIKEKLKNSLASELTISLDEELIQIPWELIFDGTQFLSLKFSIGRLVRSKGDLNTLRYRNLSENLRMLILANPTGDLHSAYSEGLNIKNQFAHKKAKMQVDFKSTSIDKTYVKKNICDYDIVHFAGHCEFNKKNIQHSGWMFSDGVLKVEEILKMGQSCDLPALIFSNACHSAELSPDLINHGYQEASFNMASAFLFAGVRHYIGSIRKIEDTASLEFARKFYIQLLSGASVGEALRIAKLKLIKDHGLSSLHWVNYLLYGDPGYVFFQSKIKKESKRLFTHKVNRAIFLGIRLIFIIVLGFLLAFWLPRLNPGKVYLFLKAQSQYHKGNNQAAVILGERTISQDQDFLAIYPVVANAYQRMGQKDKALKYYFDYMLKSEKANNKKHLTQAYIQLGWFYQLNGQYTKAQEFYNKALSLSMQLKDRLNEAVVLRKLAVWNIDKINYEVALELLTKSVAINIAHIKNYEHRKNLACDYFDIGLVFANKNDYVTAKDFYEKSRKIFQELKLENELSDCFFNLGEIYLFEKEYHKALDYYFKGLAIDQKQGNKVNLASGYNMIGELYIEMDDLLKAEEYFYQSTRLAEEINSLPDVANANYNLGLLYKLKGRKNMARECWRKAQEIYRGIDPVKFQEVRDKLLELDIS
ncbi:MAG: CHAT domain-containing protein [Candidatus Omnitrophota bacterium]|nr:CHAT domain-containing protein [Candidatus Omnitrophota bacterium]